jgi:acyl carrier protein
MRTEIEETPADVIREFISGNVRMQNLDDDFDIFGSGIVNSLFTIELMTFLERSFTIKVTMDDLDMENFKSVNAASRFVLRKRGATGA